jgi:hypothetical protein
LITVRRGAASGAVEHADSAGDVEVGAVLRRADNDIGEAVSI